MLLKHFGCSMNTFRLNINNYKTGNVDPKKISQDKKPHGLFNSDIADYEYGTGSFSYI